MSIASLLNDTFTIKRSTGSTLGADGRTAAASTTTTGPFKGRLAPRSGGLTASGGADGTRITHRLYCLTSVDIVAGDEVTMGLRGEVMKIIAPLEPSQRGHHLQVDCEELRPDTRL